MTDEDMIQQEAGRFMAYLGITPNDNYFVCYRYPKKLFGIPRFLQPWDNLTQSLITSICVVIVTPEELVIKKLSNSFAFWKLKKWDFTKHVTRLVRSQIKSFTLEDWDGGRGVMMTIRTSQQTYYLHQSGLKRNDFSTVHFNNLRGNNFYGMVTDDMSDGGYHTL